MEDWQGQLVAFIIGGGLTTILNFVFRVRDNKHEVKRSDFDRAVALIDQLQEDNTQLRHDLRELDLRYRERDCDILDLRLGILILIEQLRESGVQPRWTPAVMDRETKTKDKK